MSHKKRIAFFPLTPLGDAVVTMGILDELHRIYAPCEITVFAVPLIAELYRGHLLCSKSIELEENSDGEVFFRQIPQEHFDVVFNHGYSESWNRLLEQLDYDNAYGMEEPCRPPEKCNELFTRWVSSEYWNTVTLKKHQKVSEQMAELIRLVDPTCQSIQPTLSSENYTLTSCMIPQSKYILMLPGASSIEKCWPIGKYLQLAKFIKSAGLTPVFVTGPQDTILKNDLQASRFLYFDHLSLSELAYTAAHAQLVIGNDSGPMHLAMVFDTPSISFFSFTGADNWFQYDPGRHKVLMLPCGQKGSGCKENNCMKTCIGKIPLKEAVYTVAEMLQLPRPKLKEIACFVHDLIGDALVNIENLKALSHHYAPCSITVFCTQNNRELFDNYAFCDKVFCFTPGEWKKEDLPQTNFDAVFNNRYDLESLKIIQSLDCDEVYGYESCDITETLCKKYYTAYLPLSLWDDFELRRKTSVTEQGAALVRLVDPNFHCNAVALAENTFICDFGTEALKKIGRKTILFVPGASNKEKNWGYSNYFDLGNFLQKYGYEICFLLGPGEENDKKEIERAGFKYCSNLSFQEIAALFLVVPAVIGNDTGMMHLACAMGSKSITIAPFCSHFTWFPYNREKHRVCYPDCSSVQCMNSCRKIDECTQYITQEMVIAEVTALGIIEI